MTEEILEIVAEETAQVAEEEVSEMVMEENHWDCGGGDYVESDGVDIVVMVEDILAYFVAENITQVLREEIGTEEITGYWQRRSQRRRSW